MQPGTPPTQAFQLQEMGTDSTGSLERSDLESTKDWCGYPTPFLEHYYKTFPEEEADAPAPAPPGSGGSAYRLWLGLCVLILVIILFTAHAKR